MKNNFQKFILFDGSLIELPYRHFKEITYKNNLLLGILETTT